MHVLGRMVKAVKPGGLVLDLQVIRPNPVIEVEGRVVCEIDGEPLFCTADAATAAVDALVRDGLLVEQGVDDHDVREHYDNGGELVDAFAAKKRQPPAEMLPVLLALSGRVTVRERCRLRRLEVARC